MLCKYFIYKRYSHTSNEKYTTHYKSEAEIEKYKGTYKFLKK